MVVYVEHWERSKFQTPNPICDICSEPLRQFPVPVVHQTFDYMLIHHRKGRITGGYVMKGGMAMCPRCFAATIEELEAIGTEIIYRD